MRRTDPEYPQDENYLGTGQRLTTVREASDDGAPIGFDPSIGQSVNVYFRTPAHRLGIVDLTDMSRAGKQRIRSLGAVTTSDAAAKLLAIANADQKTKRSRKMGKASKDFQVSPSQLRALRAPMGGTSARSKQTPKGQSIAALRRQLEAMEEENEDEELEDEVSEAGSGLDELATALGDGFAEVFNRLDNIMKVVLSLKRAADKPPAAVPPSPAAVQVVLMADTSDGERTEALTLVEVSDQDAAVVLVEKLGDRRLAAAVSGMKDPVYLTLQSTGESLYLNFGNMVGVKVGDQFVTMVAKAETLA